MSLHAMAESFFVPVTPQIQVTLNCNYRCTYCFQNHCASDIMDLATAEAILVKCAEHNRSWVRGCAQGQVEIFWHGGEPLLAGIHFYREILRIQAKIPDITFKNHLQTNGALLTDAYAQFCREHDFQLGFSLDGPPEMNDLHRRTAVGGNSAFEATLRGIDNYRRHMPPGARVPVIAVVTRDTIDRAADFYLFFKELGAEVQLDFYDLRSDDLAPNAMDALFTQAPGEDQLQRFLIELFDLWFHDPDRRVDFKELREDLDMVLRQETFFRNPMHKKRCSPGRTIFNPQGLVFACDQYVCDPATAIGDIHHNSVATLMRRKAALWDSIKTVIRKAPEAMACSRCDWGRLCMGGCLTCMKYNAMLLAARAEGLPDECWRDMPVPPSLAALSGETYYCEALRGLRRHIGDTVDRELNKAHGS